VLPGRRSLAGWARYYRGELSASTQVNLAYRGQVLIWLFSSVVQPLVMIPVWQAVAGPGGSVGGYTPALFVTYFAAQMLTDHLTFIWLMWEFEWRVREGMFSPLLLRPIHPIHKDVCDNISYKLVGLVGILPAAVLLMIVFRGDVSVFTPARVGWYLLAVLGAGAMRFVLEWAMSLAAFWLTRMTAWNNVYTAITYFLSGSFAPLAVLPLVVQHIAWWSPFPWMIAFPIQALMGTTTGTDLLVGFGLQLGWLVVALVIMNLVWHRALRRYSAVGA